MVTSATLISKAHERKVENLRAFMVNLANSKGLVLPETKLFEHKFLDLCSSQTPDHLTYSAMIFIAITELNEEGGSCEEAISEFIKSKYKNLPFAHTSLLSHHLAKLVKKKEILCDCNNYCYSLPGEKKKTVASTDAVNEVMIHQNKEETVRFLKSENSKGKACGGINVVEVKFREDNGVKARNSTIEPEVAPEKGEIESRIEVNSEGCELYEIPVLYEQNDMVMEDSGKGKDKLIEIISKQRTTKEACVEVKSEASKPLGKCQTEECSNFIALEEMTMLEKCSKKDQQNKAVPEIDVVSRQIDFAKKPQVKKTRVKRVRDIETTVLRKSPRGHKPV